MLRGGSGSANGISDKQRSEIPTVRTPLVRTGALSWVFVHGSL